MSAIHETNELANLPLQPDAVLQERYRIVRQLGRGGMGAVYEAVDQRLGITVALKETLSSEASLRKQFELEACLLASMQHPALPRVSDHFVEGNRAFLVMQYIGGVDLARIISQQPGPFPCDQVIAWADQLLDALIYLHSRDRQVIHRDIKPHNLKLTATGQIALLDFGLAKAQPSDPSVTSSHAFFGYTRHYAPLEQIQDQRTDPRSDIYALGATLYHLLTGIKPPDAMVRASALINSESDPLVPANRIHEVVGPHLSGILNKAMAQKPEDRYATADDFREALRRMGRTTKETNREPRLERGFISDGEITQAPRTPPAADLRMSMVVSGKRFGPAGVTAVIVVLLTLAGGIFYGSHGWFDALGEGVSVTSQPKAVATQRLSPVTRKPDRSRVSENVLASAKPRNSVVSTSNPPEKKKSVSFVPAAIVKPASVSPRKMTPAIEPRRKPQRVQVPSLRLPNADFRDSFSEPSPEVRIRSFGAASSFSPKFFRASDGSLIVKFSDGSTRTVRPGERSAQPDGSYR